MKGAPFELGVVGEEDAVLAASNMAFFVSTVATVWWKAMSSVMAEVDMIAVSARRPAMASVVIRPMNALHQL